MGYDIERFQTTDINEELICSICQDVLKEPVLIELCQHIFCKECINEWLTKSTVKMCPIDRNEISVHFMRQPDRPFCNILNSLLIDCEYSNVGCPIRTTIEQIQHHETQCKFNPMICNQVAECPSGCGAQVKHIDLPQHNCVVYLKTMLDERELMMGHEKIANDIAKNELSRKIEEQRDEINMLRQQLESYKNMTMQLRVSNNGTMSEQTMKQLQLEPQPHNHTINVSNDEFYVIPTLINLEIDQEIAETTSSLTTPTTNESNDECMIDSSLPLESQTHPRKSSMLSSSMFKRKTSESNHILIDSLCAKGLIKKSRVVEAMLEVDRGNFAQAKDTTSYILHHVRSIGYGAHAGPSIYEAKLLEYLAEYIPEHQNDENVFKILDVGVGTGYLTTCIAVMMKSYGKVVGIDHIPQLVEQANQTLQNFHNDLLEMNRIKIVTADGQYGYALEAPYDLIFVEAVSKRIPFQLIEQLKCGGRIIMPIGSKDKGITLELIVKQSNGSGVVRMILNDDWRLREYVIDVLDDKKTQLRSGWKARIGL